MTKKEKLILCDSGEAWRLKSVDVDISIFDESMKGGDVIWAQSGKLFVRIQRVEFLFSCHSMTPSLALSARFKVRGDNFIVKLAIE